MYIDMPTGDSIFTDTKRQFIFVILSFIVSIIYLKKTWYEYWGLWMMLLSFVMFSVFTAGAKTQLMGSLMTIFPSELTNNMMFQFGIGILALSPFVLILIALIILVYVSTAIVRKKHEGKITGNHAEDNMYRRTAFILTHQIKENDELIDPMDKFFNAFDLNTSDFTRFKQSFDILISGFSFLIFFVYSSQFAEMIRFQPITYDEYSKKDPKTKLDKFRFWGQPAWLSITWLSSVVLGAIGVDFSGQALKLYRRMRDNIIA
jgi:hypothetical protein